MSTGTEVLLIGPDDRILVTGSTGFIGRSVVRALMVLGFSNLRCLTRSTASRSRLDEVLGAYPTGGRVEVVTGNLLSPEDCRTVAKDVSVVFHLAAGRGEKSYPDAFLNSVVTTRNLLDACVQEGVLRRFVNISSFAVYTNAGRRTLDESSPVESRAELRGSAYCFAKVEQDKLVEEYGRRYGIPHVTIRPGYVCGPGNPGIHSRVGIGTFGVFLHLGGGNSIPLTYVDNCADAIALAGLTKGVDGEVFNVVDDNLPSSRTFLRLYKRRVRRFRSLYVPHAMSYVLCRLWEWYSIWSDGQLPPAYNRRLWHATWKKTRYSNDKLKSMVGWKPLISTPEALERHFAGCREGVRNA